MHLKTTLKIQLLAGDVLVAESTDEQLWRRVLAALQSGQLSPDQPASDAESDIEGHDITNAQKRKGLAGFAAELGVDVAMLTGACGPVREAPYIHLDSKCWEAFKRNVPSRGRTSVSPTQIAATFLCLWFQFSGIDRRPTQAQTTMVLDELGITDKNASRGIKNCEWLQMRDGGIQLNPARLSRATSVAAAFVKRAEVEDSR